MSIIGIAGGSGSGKSTIASLLVDKYPDKIETINLDKYKISSTKKSDFPIVKGMVDWDSPDIIRWEKLMEDIQTLQNGRPVTIEIRSVEKPQELVYRETKLRTIYSKEVLIVEGYLALWHEELRRLLSRKYYLNLSLESRLQRRDKIVDSAYDKEIHIPAHNKYVEPTKKFANVVFDTSKLSADEIAREIIRDLKKFHLFE